MSTLRTGKVVAKDLPLLACVTEDPSYPLPRLPFLIAILYFLLFTCTLMNLGLEFKSKALILSLFLDEPSSPILVPF